MNRRKPTIGIYCPGAGTGGPWRYVHFILGELELAEFDVTVFCDLPGAYEPRPAVKVVRLGGSVGFQGGASVAASPPREPRNGSKFGALVPRPLKLWAGFGRETRRLASLIRRHPVDLFHTQNTGCEESPVAARVAGVPNVLGTFHVDSTYDLQRERNDVGHRLLEVVSNRCLHSAIAVSHATKRDWVQRTRIRPGRVEVIHNGIDPEMFSRRRPREEARAKLGLPSEGLIVGGLGRLDEAKGFAFLLDAAAQLRPEFPNFCVVIAGDGPLRKVIEARAVTLGMADRVRFLGFQSDVQLVLDALDVFALPSLCEALPYALLEAMAAELPTVGAAVGGVPEVIVPGATGFLAPPRDATALAQALRGLLADAELRSRMGAAARARVIREFHVRDMVRKTIQVYRNSLSRKVRP